MDYLTVGAEYRIITDKQFNISNDKMETGLGVELNRKFYRDMLKLMIRGGYNFNIGLGAGNGDINFGGGIEFNYMETAYRIDYAIKKMEYSDILGNMHYFSFTMSESLTLFKWILREIIPLPHDILNYNDYFSVKTVKQDTAEMEKMKKERVYGVKLAEIKSQEQKLIDSGIVDKMEGFLVRRIKEKKQLKWEKTKGDIIIKGELKHEGEILRFFINVIDPVTKKILKKDSFEISADFLTYSVNYDTLQILMRESDDNVQLIPKEEGEQSKEVDRIIQELSEKAIDEIDSNIREILSGDIIIKCGMENVNIYIDGFYYGQTDEDGEIKFDLYRGKHKIELKLAKFQTEAINVNIKPGDKKDFSIKLKKRIVYNE